MGANRAMRRKQEREQIREWKQKGQLNQVLTLQKNGITEKDLDLSYKKGYDAGYIKAAEDLLRKVYAAVAQELIDAGNPRDDVVSFLVGTDRRFCVMYDADDEIENIFNQIGVYFNISAKDAVNRVREVET